MPEKIKPIIAPAKKNKDVRRRGQAQQKRSHQKVEKILSVTLDLMSATTTENIDTKSIAKASNVSIGTLYRFFPNKEAIYYELYRRWLKMNEDALDRLIAQLPVDASPDTFMDCFIDIMTEPQLNTHGHWQLRLAMGTSQKLADLEAQHRFQIIQRIILLQSKYGKLPPAHLAEDIMRLQNEMTIACLFSIAKANDANTETLKSLCKTLLKQIFTFEK